MGRTEKLEKQSLGDYSLGLNTKTNPRDLKKNESQDCLNVLFDEKPGLVVKRKGKTFISTVTGDVAVVRSYAFITSAGTILPIVQLSNFKIYYASNMTTWTELVPLRTTGVALTFSGYCTFETFESMCWISNGVDDAVIFDGSDSDHAWVLDGETYTGAGFEYPTGKSDPWITPNVPAGKYIKLWQERLFMVDTTDNGAEARFSRYYNDAGTDIYAYDADAWVATNQVAIAQDDGQSIRGVACYRGNLIFFKRNSIYVLRGTQPAYYTIDQIQSEVGCSWHWTIKEYENFLIFLGGDGIYSFDGTSVLKLSEKLQNWVDTWGSVFSDQVSWIFTTTAHWNTGTFSDHATDTANHQVIPKLQVATVDWDESAWNVRVWDEIYQRWLGYGGYAISEVINFGFTPTSFGKLLVNISTHSSYTLQFQTRSSSDNITWSAWQNTTPSTTPNGTINSTVAQYLQWRIYNNPVNIIGYNAPTIEGVIIGDTTWRSPVKDIGTTPSAWGKLEVALDKNDQTCNFYMRSGASEAACLAASWVNVTENTIILNSQVTFAQFIQFEIRFSTDTYTQRPAVGGMTFGYYKTGFFNQDAQAIVWNGRYYLTVVSQNSTTCDLVIPMKFVSTATGKTIVFSHFEGLNIASWILYGKDMYGGSSVDGDWFQIFSGYSDAGTAIDAWFETKDFDLGFADNQKRLRYLWLNAEQPGNHSLTTTWSFDAGVEYDFTVNLEVDGGTYNRRYSFASGTRGKFLRFKFGNNVDTQQMEVKGIDLYYSVLPLRHLTSSVDGGGGIVPRNWTESTRPTNPYVGQTGFNTDFQCYEDYMGASLWKVKDGNWATSDARPDTTYLAIGSFGWNSELSVSERWTGIEWERD